MQIFDNIADIQDFISKNKVSIGFVPTMGALHEGHLQLIDRSKKENNLTVCSIFVNPTQFNNPQDLAKYPRTLEQDCKLLENRGCDVVFAPSAEQMYPSLPKLKFDFGKLETIMEGEFRPGHFNGVGIVVSKLFNIVKPTRAYFGQKDIQQVAVISLLVKDLSFDLELVVCDTVREASGLAMSSRNRRLSQAALLEAPKIYESLLLGKKLLNQNQLSVAEVKAEIKKFFENTNFELEYYEITDFESLTSIEKIDNSKKTALIIAAYINEVRLIDNLVF